MTGSIILCCYILVAAAKVICETSIRTYSSARSAAVAITTRLTSRRIRGFINRIGS